MSQLEIERRPAGGFPWWIVGLVAVLLLLVIIGVLVSRTAGAASPADLAVDGNDVAAVLVQGSLARTLSYGGMTWEAVQVVRFEKETPLVAVGPKVDGRPLYSRRRAPTDPPRTLYLPVAQVGPYAGVYLRYNPVP